MHIYDVSIPILYVKRIILPLIPTGIALKGHTLSFKCSIAQEEGTSYWLNHGLSLKPGKYVTHLNQNQVAKSLLYELVRLPPLPLR